ncbi:MAG: SAM-dependent methyltransferase, partial [Acidimicrobiales bacterium]
ILEAASVRQVRSQLLAAGLATSEEIETHLENLAGGELDLMLAPMVTAWGRKLA